MKSKQKLVGFTLFVILTLQLFSLFRALPSTPACGQIRSLGLGAQVLINCDSAVFMKDAQDPSRLISGESVYQDRPLYSSLSWLISKSLIEFGLPDHRTKVIGNSGVETEYSAIFYLSYLLINLFTLASAVILGVSWFLKKKETSVKWWIKYFAVVNVILIISANEITKTFFWTPHSQMFNILLPVYALYLQSNSKKLETKAYFIINSIIISILMLFYSLVILLFFFLLKSSFSTMRKRILIIGGAIVPYMLWPFLIQWSGGTYQNINFTRYREFIWVYDAIIEKILLERILGNWRGFISTVPIFPTLLLLLFLLIIIKIKNLKFLTMKFITNSSSQFFIIYFVALSFMGYNARRLTMGPYIYLELLCFASFFSYLQKYSPRGQIIGLAGLAIPQSIFWVFTHGPMA